MRALTQQEIKRVSEHLLKVHDGHFPKYKSWADNWKNVYGMSLTNYLKTAFGIK